MSFNSIDAIKAANERAGHYFFERSSMRFFNSKVASQTVIHGCYFITSEQFCDGSYVAPRKYTIRQVNEQGHVSTVGDFQAYATVEEAKVAARLLEPVLA